ncbi:hypothetical protein M9H77_02043 [Catharanthus roseus]|uniref:Uncharacterized protein n=1 Tax=Catharanthus roseus TaxID=4058 RepID=A0ACC0C7P8_CATRO|nr:hypothetical protein M9H77_02043 [Catharanthus roseus]
MVRPRARRGDADLGPVTDRTSQVEGCPVTDSSRGEVGSSTQPPAIPFRSRPLFQPHLSHTSVPYEPYGSTHLPSHPIDTAYDSYLHAPTIVRPRIPYRSVIQEPILFAGSRNKRPEVARDVPAPTQKMKKVKPSDLEQTEAAEGGSVHPELIPSYGGHVCRSRYMALTGLELTDLQVGPLASGLSSNSVDHRLSRDQLMHWSFTLLLLADRLHSHIRTQDVCDYWVSTWHRMWVLRNTFVETLWLEAPSHLFTKTWTSVPAIPASSCTDDYIDWYLPCTHPRIQNPGNILSGYNVPVAPAMPPKALLDLIVRESHRQDIEGDEFRRRVRDLLRQHYIAL